MMRFLSNSHWTLVVCVCLMATGCSAFMPTFDNLATVFGSLFQKTQTVDRVTRNAADQAAKRDRARRQSLDIGDESQLTYEIRASSLPTMADRATINSRYMPTLGNGQIGATVYDDSLYLNGLYAGVGDKSHRARIPAFMSTRVTLPAEVNKRAIRKFIFNSRDGYFMETIDCDFAYIEHKTYIHQKYIRAYVTDFYARRKDGSPGGGEITMTYPAKNISEDITFNAPREYFGNWEMKGTTKSAEAGENPADVYVFYMEPLLQISISGSNWQINHTQFMTVDRQESNARSDFDAVMAVLQQKPEKQGNYQLFREHIQAWQNTWAAGKVEIEGDTQLAKVANFGQYYLVSSLPAEFPFLAPQHSEVFHGCGRTGLAKGGLGKDYQGHVMWDNEMYILPAILPFHPNMAKKVLRYRTLKAAKAAENAKRFGGEGYHYPWESAASGADVSPNNCPADQPDCNWKKFHVTAAVAYGIRLYYSITRDRDYMVNPDYNGCDLTREIARFLASRGIYNPYTSHYDVYNMTGPDELHPNINNGAFTLAAMSLAIHWARYFACQCQRNEREEVPDLWVQKAMYFNLPYDNVKRMHYEYTGFNPATEKTVKQADVVMMNYPLNWNYSVDIMKNDLEFYETITSAATPAMTWSWFTIGWKWVNDMNRLAPYFLKSYQSYLVQPFKIWTEYNERTNQDQAVGNVNFLPGIGAFIQSLIYGFAGLRIRPDALEFHSPMLPGQATRMTLFGINYIGSTFDVIIEPSATTVRVKSVDSTRALVFRKNITFAVEESFTAGAVIKIDQPKTGFYLYPKLSDGCEQPRDYIFMPWGYSPWINAGPALHKDGGLLRVLCHVTFVLLGCIYYRVV